MNRTARSVFAALLAPLAASCVKNEDSTFLFSPYSTKQSVSASTPIVVRERWMAYLADELTTGAGGTDFNADGDTIDQIAVLINSVGVTETRLDAAAEELALVGTHLYLVTEEAEDEVDWDLDGSQDDLVLLHTPCSGASPATVGFVATLSRSGSGPRLIATANDRLFFMEQPPAADPLAAPETAISMIKLVSGVPQPAARLLNDDNVTTLSPELAGEDSGIVFVTLNETLEGRNLNGDSDSTDDFVLALIDSTSNNPKVRSTELAVSSATSPMRALAVGSDWVVAFLVDEAAQDSGSLNNYAGSFANWRPTHCAGDGNDTDMADEVLHFLRFNAWFAGTSDPFDTAFAGVDRVLLAKNGNDVYVATIVPEGDDGNCPVDGLNNDGDITDNVLRWIKVETALGSSGVFISDDGLVALANVPGGAHGVTDIAGRWIVVIDEDADGRNWDAQVAEHDIVAWLDPSDGNGAAWTVDHSICASGCGGVQAAGASWMGEDKTRARVFIAFQEAVYGASINGRDTDQNDSVPTFARFDPSDAADFDFPGPAIAVDDGAAGVSTAGGLGFFRVDEAADNFDWNDDGDKLDRALFRTTVSTMQDTNFLGTLSNLARPALATDSLAICGAFIADESMAGRDLNGDGDQNDYVLRWLRIGS